MALRDGTSISGAPRLEMMLAPYPAIRLKLNALIAEADSRFERMSNLWTRVGEAREAKGFAAGDLGNLHRAEEQNRLLREHRLPDGSVELRVDQAAIDQAQAALAGATGRLDSVTATHKAASLKWRSGKNLADSCEAYLLSLRSIARHDAEPTPVAIGDDPLAALAAIRAEISELDAEAARITKAPQPADEARAMIKASVARLAAGGVPILFNDAVQWPGKFAEGQVHASDDSLAVLCWLFPDVVEAKLATLIGARPGAMAASEKQAARGQIETDRLELGRAEEAVITGIEATGLEVDRRADADPRAVLGIEGQAPRER